MRNSCRINMADTVSRSKATLLSIFAQLITEKNNLYYFLDRNS